MFHPAIQEIPCEQHTERQNTFAHKIRGYFLLFFNFFTFSTGFSTELVKKSSCFPQRFPLFPLSFQQFQSFQFIHHVFFRGHLRRIPGETGAFFLFSERKSNPAIYLFQFPVLPPFSSLRIGIPSFEFSTSHSLQNTVVENRENTFVFHSFPAMNLLPFFFFLLKYGIYLSKRGELL